MNTTLDLIRFEFTEPLHISNARADYAKSEDGLHSDTLAAAIMQSWALIGRPEWISDSPGFVTSSLFPFTSVSGEYIYFFPKPIKDQSANQLPSGWVKPFKKIGFYEKELFEQRLQGRLNVNINEIRDGFLTKTIPAGQTGFYTKSVMPRIMRPRDTGDDTSIFYMERRTFKNGSGLFCLVSFRDPDSRKRFFAGLKLLSENGLGSDRTVGNGKFDYSEDSMELDLPSESEYSISLSLFLPESEISLKSMIDNATRYEMIRRGGWISEPFNTLRKRSVYMFSEGSVFKQATGGVTVKGKIADLKPLSILTHHAIYRTGESIFLPIKNI